MNDKAWWHARCARCPIRFYEFALLVVLFLALGWCEAQAYVWVVE